MRPVVLCVDDEKIVLTSLKEQLKNRLHNYSIEVAESGNEALEIIDELRESKVDLPLVISDYIMPGMKGDELLRNIHQNIPDTMKILLTGQATIDGVTNAVNDANLYRYIAKPWEQEDLYLTVTEALKSFYNQKQLEEQNLRLESLNQELKQMIDAVVETMVAALDTRDVTTAGHSKRLAGYAVKLAEAVSRADYVHFTQEQIQELYYAALLHDIGKIGIKESILQKQFRLSEEHQRSLVYRFKYYQKYLQVKSLLGEISENQARTLERIDEYLNFIMEISKKSYITDEEEKKINEIAQIEYFDTDNKVRTLLNDFELESLTVKKGNLTREEREIINTHVEHTYNILKGIPWSETLKLVPEIASCHHERVNGTGYARGLKGEQIPVQSKILALLDIFEALTALDRPYKPPMSVDKAIGIVKEEVEAEHLDKDIFEIFMKEKIYDLYKSVLIK